VPAKDDHLRQLNAELDGLRRALVKMKAQISLESPTPRRAEALETMLAHVNALKTSTRLLQTDLTESWRRLEQAERDAWAEKVRRADATAKLKGRERLLEQIQNSVAWKAVKPIWKLFHRSGKGPAVADSAADLAFAFDLPKHWVTSREVLLIKGWCFSQSGRAIAGVRAKIGKKARLARYGLERADIAASFPEHPSARQSGFTIELRVPPGRSMIQIEAIEQGADWEPFFESELRRENTGGSIEPEETADQAEKMVERIVKLSPLSASKAFGLVRAGFQKHARRIADEPPLISVITPCHNTRPEWIAEAALSLLNQTLPNWEWCLVDDHSENRETKTILQSLSTISPRVRVATSPAKGISAATNSGLDLARGRYVCFLDHDDILHPRALQAVAGKLEQGDQVVYTDEDKLDDSSGALVEPFFKPDWSPEYFRGAMYVGHLLCVERELARQTRFDSTYDGVQDFEFMLRVSELAPRIGHIPEALYHWRKTPGSIAENTDAKPMISMLQERAVNTHLQRLKLPARAEQAGLPHRLKIIPATPATFPRISIIIPTRDAPKVFERCLASLFGKTSYSDFEVVVIDNDTTDPAAIALMEKYPVRRIAFPGRFNFSRANNEGAAAATGELLVFLNNDTEVVANDWLQHLAYYAQQPEVGAAGALLAYEDKTVQHAGVALGMRGTADHVMRRFPIDVDGYAGSLVCAREVSAVTGACLMTRKALFNEVGGFNEHFFTAYQDVDLCLRLRARGLRIIATPQALLFHHESTSRQKYYDMIDRMLLLDLWESAIDRGDPYYNRNLDLERGDYSRRST
jgi:GT2 family glycosyltransferase